MLRFFPPEVTGTISLVIGVSLMRIGINWIFGNPVGPTTPLIVDTAHAEWLQAVVKGLAVGTITGVPELPAKLGLDATQSTSACFDVAMTLTMTLVMIVVKIVSSGIFLSRGDMTGKPVDRPMLSAGLRTEGLGTL